MTFKKAHVAWAVVVTFIILWMQPSHLQLSLSALLMGAAVVVHRGLKTRKVPKRLRKKAVVARNAAAAVAGALLIL